MPAALDVNWPVLQVEFSHGVSIAELSRKYGVSEGTIKARSARHQWITTRPSSHTTEVAGLQGDSATRLQPTPLTQALQQGAQSVGQSLQDAGQAYAARMFKKVSALAEAANLPPPKNWRDAEVADKIARRAAGLDHQEISINTVIGVGGMDDAPVFGLDSAEVVTLPE